MIEKYGASMSHILMILFSSVQQIRLNVRLTYPHLYFYLSRPWCSIRTRQTVWSTTNIVIIYGVEIDFVIKVSRLHPCVKIRALLHKFSKHKNFKLR